MPYPDWQVGWLLNIMQSFDYSYSPLEILETENKYPGLWDSLSIERWQTDLIDEQINNDGE